LSLTDEDIVTTKKDYRNFGLIVGAIFIVISFIPVIKGREYNIYNGSIGAILILLSLIAPMILSPVYKIWMKVGHVLGKINAFIILSVIYYVFITPVSIGIRFLKGQDKKFAFKTPDKTAWIKCEQGNPSQDMKRMF